MSKEPANNANYRSKNVLQNPIQGSRVAMKSLQRTSLGRPTLVCGNAGCGKTLLSIEYILRGAREFDEPGVFMAFEERE